MESALGWIGSFFEFLIDLIPHLITVDGNEIGLKYSRGKHRKVLRPGIHFFWPIVTNDPTKITTARTTLMLPAQRLTTRDGETIILSLGVIGRVVDVEKAIHETDDLPDAIEDAALRAATVPVLAREHDQILRDIVDNTFITEVTRKCRSSCREFGYHVESCLVADFAMCKVLAHVGGISLGDDEDD